MQIELRFIIPRKTPRAVLSESSLLTFPEVVHGFLLVKRSSKGGCSQGQKPPSPCVPAFVAEKG